MQEEDHLPSECWHFAGRGETVWTQHRGIHENYTESTKGTEDVCVMEGLGKAAGMKCHLKMDRVLASREGGWVLLGEAVHHGF